jgi:uncharacterized protein (DUF1501 family)
MPVRGRQTPPTQFRFGFYRTIGVANQPSLPPEDPATQLVQETAAWQFGNEYLSDYNRKLRLALQDEAGLSRAEERGVEPAQDFGSSTFGTTMRSLARVMPALRDQGLRRQIYFVGQGSYDTHAEQRGSAKRTQDYHLADLAPALAAFDGAMESAGLGEQVTVLCISEFGRTLRPSSGGGSEHAWGNHWLALGGAVRGGQVLGTFPGLTLGGPDDVDEDQGGRLLPSTASDQVYASCLQWLGLPADQLHDVLPWLANFEQKSVALLRSS